MSIRKDLTALFMLPYLPVHRGYNNPSVSSVIRP